MEDGGALKLDVAGFCDVRSRMLTLVGWYAGVTLSSCVRVTGGASEPHPSSSTLASDLLATLDGNPEL